MPDIFADIVDAVAPTPRSHRDVITVGSGGAAWYSGAGAPSSGAHLVGDFYLNETNGDVYEKTGSSTWTLRTNIFGTDGDDGADGATWSGGSGAPSGGSGVVGDFYLDTSTCDIYKKTGVSTWTLQVNIKGTTGTPGSSAMQYVRKGSDEAVSNSVTLQDDDALFINIGVAEEWKGKFVLYYKGLSGSGGGDVRINFSMPAGCTLHIGVIAPGTVVTTSTGDNARFTYRNGVGSDTTLGTSGTAAGNENVAVIEFVIYGASSSGQLKLRWAQGTTSATASTVLAGSHVEAIQH